MLSCNIAAFFDYLQTIPIISRPYLCPLTPLLPTPHSARQGCSTYPQPCVPAACTHSTCVPAACTHSTCVPAACNRSMYPYTNPNLDSNPNPDPKPKPQTYLLSLTALSHCPVLSPISNCCQPPPLPSNQSRLLQHHQRYQVRPMLPLHPIQLLLPLQPSQPLSITHCYRTDIRGAEARLAL